MYDKFLSSKESELKEEMNYFKLSQLVYYKQYEFIATINILENKEFFNFFLTFKFDKQIFFDLAYCFHLLN